MWQPYYDNEFQKPQKTKTLYMIHDHAYPDISFMKCVGPEALASSTILKKCDVITSSGVVDATP